VQTTQVRPVTEGTQPPIHDDAHLPSPSEKTPGPDRSGFGQSNAAQNGTSRVASEPLSSSHRRLLLVLAVFSVMAGYQGSVLTAILTYAADGWDASLAARGRSLAVLRADIVLTLVIVRAADRIGRRRTLLFAAVVSAVFNAISAITNSLLLFDVVQFVARGANTAVAILVAVFVTENLPKGRRAWGSALMIGAAAMGTGFVLAVASLADRGPNWWRLIAIPSIGFLGAVLVFGRFLPESIRFQQSNDRATTSSRSKALIPLLRAHWKRLCLIGVFTALFSFEVGPTRQLQNDYLRFQHGFSSVAVSTFGIFSNAPGIIGLMIGGRMSDRIGRKKVIAIGLIGFAIGDAGLMLTSGSWLWVFSALGAMVGGSCLAAMGVLPTELFPTSMRATADGFSVGAGRIGGALGVLFVGEFATKNHPGPVLALTTVAIWFALLALYFIPETSNQELVE
jgi:MFS family permease